MPPTWLSTQAFMSCKLCNAYARSAYCFCCSLLREVLYTSGPDGKPVVTGLKVGQAGKEQLITADAYVAALDVPGAQRLIPQAWRKYTMFENIYKLVGVPVITVQLR